MNTTSRYLLLTAVTSLAFGAFAIVPIVNSDNGYVAGFIFFPLLLLICGFSALLMVAGLVAIILRKRAGILLLLASILLPVGFFGAGMTAKHLELGAYREDPMVPLTPEMSNIVLLKANISNDEINSFWNQTLSTERKDGRGQEHLPGVRGITRMPPKDGHEIIEFSFAQGATEEQRHFVHLRVRSSPHVFTLLENVATDGYMYKDQSLSTEDTPKKR